MAERGESRGDPADATKSDDVSRTRKVLTCLKTNWETIAIFSGVIAGIILGGILKESGRTFTQREVMYIAYVGDIFLNMLKSLIIPLIMSSLVSAIASLDISLSGRVAARAILFYLTTTFMAVVIGIVLVATIKPGSHQIDGRNSSLTPVLKRNVTTVDTLLDLLKNMFPPNIVQACLEQAHTHLVPPAQNPNEPDLYKWDIKREYTRGTNILGLIVVAVAIGIALAQLHEAALTLANFFHSLMAVTMKITVWVIRLSPLGIMFLVASKILEMDDVVVVMAQLGLYFGTVLLGLFIQGFMVLPFLYFLLTRKSPYRYLLNLSQAICTAFGTASSAATLPITIRCLEENSGIDPRIARFTLPIGAAINMDGTALYEAVAAIFIAQIRQLDLTIGSYIAISLAATAASIGAAGIPQAGLVTMVMVLDTVGLPPEDVSLILTVDWLLDRFRTVINVIGDAFGAGIVNHLSRNELAELPPFNS